MWPSGATPALGSAAVYKHELTCPRRPDFTRPLTLAWDIANKRFSEEKNEIEIDKLLNIYIDL